MKCETPKQNCIAANYVTAFLVVTPQGSEQVIAYYCLSAGSVERQLLPNRVTQNLPDPVLAVVLGRLAVDQTYEGLGLGRGLLNS